MRRTAPGRAASGPGPGHSAKGAPAGAVASGLRQASYVAVVSRIGPEFLTVTSHLAIDFLRKPPPADLRVHGHHRHMRAVARGGLLA